ncbi:MAG: calcium-binding protein [Microcoleus sp. SU_5_3]|nr:calcium-binding protein [Microcoleus sp. SU_5_3]
MAAITGTPGDDKLTGTNAGDLIRGLAGNDFVLALDGDDDIFGNSGNDNLQGGNGNDEIEGDDGDDTIFGGNNDDFLLGDGTEAENFFGNDVIFAGTGNDTVDGGRGDNQLFGQEGNDRMFGGGGSDIIEGGSGNDTLFGDNRTGSAGDRLIGVDDLRFLVRPGQGEIDYLTGGNGLGLNAGQDVFVLGDVNRVYYDDGIVNNSGRSDFAVITDFSDGSDRIELKGGVTYSLSSVSNLPGGVSGVGIFARLDNSNELIGVVRGVNASQLQINNGAAGSLTTIS